MEDAIQNMRNAAHVFICTVWLQGQMSDLVILKTHPHLVRDFVSAVRVPDAFHAIRVRYWEKDFSQVKRELFDVFRAELAESEKRDIEQIFQLRNAIAHAHISAGRPYMLFRPSSNSRERSMIEAFNTAQREEFARPTLFKLQFTEELFQRVSDQIGRIDQVCFARLSDVVGVQHSRIR